MDQALQNPVHFNGTSGGPQFREISIEELRQYYAGSELPRIPEVGVLPNGKAHAPRSQDRTRYLLFDSKLDYILHFVHHYFKDESLMRDDLFLPFVLNQKSVPIKNVISCPRMILIDASIDDLIAAISRSSLLVTAEVNGEPVVRRRDEFASFFARHQEEQRRPSPTSTSPSVVLPRQPPPLPVAANPQGIPLAFYPLQPNTYVNHARPIATTTVRHAASEQDMNGPSDSIRGRYNPQNLYNADSQFRQPFAVGPQGANPFSMNIYQFCNPAFLGHPNLPTQLQMQPYVAGQNAPADFFWNNFNPRFMQPFYAPNINPYQSFAQGAPFYQNGFSIAPRQARQPLQSEVPRRQGSHGGSHITPHNVPMSNNHRYSTNYPQSLIPANTLAETELTIALGDLNIASNESSHVNTPMPDVSLSQNEQPVVNNLHKLQNNSLRQCDNAQNAQPDAANIDQSHPKNTQAYGNSKPKSSNIIE